VAGLLRDGLRAITVYGRRPRPSGFGRRLPLFSPWGDPCRVRSIAKVRIMDTSLARLEPIPAKFRSLAAQIQDVDDWCEQAGRLLLEFIDAGGLDDPRNVVTAYQIRGHLEGFDLRPGSDDWSQLWNIAKWQLLTCKGRTESVAAGGRKTERPIPTLPATRGSV